MFTQLEWEIIEHRLGAPDAIGEALESMIEETLEESPREYKRAYKQDEIESRAYSIRENGSSSINWDNELDRLIIEDCCDGSTFFCDIEQGISDGNLTRKEAIEYKKAASRIAKKTGVFVAESNFQLPD